ncbi:hypothetical protein [Bosea sp. (in: a-proteobacteria)]|uniref:hypothetical protein n=1 Tax=Bosea sp. (in: a-proteobacteria) TaxID=1871050 RepID=UPI003B3A3F84
MKCHEPKRRTVPESRAAKSDSYFNYIRVRSFALNGAPTQYGTATTRSVRHCPQSPAPAWLYPDDTDEIVVELGTIENGPEIGLAERHVQVTLSRMRRPNRSMAAGSRLVGGTACALIRSSAAVARSRSSLRTAILSFNMPQTPCGSLLQTLK